MARTEAARMRNLRNTAPMTLLDIIKNGYFQQVRVLVDHGVDLDQRDAERRTALMLCAFIEPESWGVGICRLLIENGATLYFRDKHGLNAFHYAVIYDRVELVRVYLKAIDFDLNECDKLGNTALHYAVKSGNSLVVRLIAQACLKYQIDWEKQNNDGFTPLQEARRLNKRKCARVLENMSVIADESNIEAHLPLELNSGEFDGETMSVKSSRKSFSRPRSSVISHRSSKSSLISTSDLTYNRTTSLYSNDLGRQIRRRRDPSAIIPPHEKNHKQLIRCASASDVRNNAEYLFHMSPFDSSFSGDHLPQQTKVRAKSAFVRRSEVENGTNGHKANWRTEFRKLYMHYQFQCTPSYRDTVTCESPETASLPPLDKPMTPATSEHAIDDMDKSKKRVKSGSISRQNTDESLMGGKTRQQTKPGRKMSQNIGHGGKVGSTDGSLESSSESISSVSSKRQADGKISSKPPKPDAAGRTSRVGNHKQIPSVNVEEARGRSPTTTDNSSVDPRMLNVINE